MLQNLLKLSEIIHKGMRSAILELLGEQRRTARHGEAAVCMYVCVHACVYVFIYVCMYVSAVNATKFDVLLDSFH